MTNTTQTTGGSEPVEIKRPDLVARYLSVVAIAVSVISVWTSYKMSVAARIEASRPRLALEMEAVKNKELSPSPSLLHLKVDAINGGLSPARDVRATAKAVRTNAPQYAFAQFRASAECIGTAPSLTGNLYSTKQAGVIISLDLSHIQSVMNPEQSYTSGDTTFLNGPPAIVIVGCVSYKMDDVGRTYVEPIFQEVDIRCGPDRKRCVPSPNDVVSDDIEYLLFDPS